MPSWSTDSYHDKWRSIKFIESNPHVSLIPNRAFKQWLPNRNCFELSNTWTISAWLVRSSSFPRCVYNRLSHRKSHIWIQSTVRLARCNEDQYKLPIFHFYLQLDHVFLCKKRDSKRNLLHSRITSSLAWTTFDGTECLYRRAWRSA